MTPRPRVAVPTYHLGLGRVSGWVAGGHALPETYVGSLRRAGVRPLLLPVGEPGPADELLEGFDGLLLAGGGDIDPNRYDADPHPDQYGVDTDRDATELDLLLAAREAGLPVLAICRGIQLVNVATGGTLHQHLPDDTGRMTHGDPMGGLSASHGVTVTEGSALAEAVGRRIIAGETTQALRIERCTSHHHQGIERVGGGLRAVGWSDDGLVEALEPEGDGPWMVAVQWHPEVTAEQDPVQQAIFDAFGLQCAAFARLATVSR